MASGDLPGSLDGTRSCDYGVRNRTWYCVKGDNVVQAGDCPIEFTANEEESCELSCDRESKFLDWSEYSPCSVTCGSGTKTRFKPLIQFPSDPQQLILVDENGLKMETVMCSEMSDCPVGEYVWAGNDWSECMLFSGDSTVCGLGYQTTPLTCINDDTGERVDDTLCSHLPPPPTARSCVTPCPDRCILTEWTDYTLCENGRQNRSRQLIPFLGSDSWEVSCPQLFSPPQHDGLSLTETASCPFSLERYDYSVVTLYSSTIIEDPLAVCGNGQSYRSVVCVDMADRRPHHEEFCVGKDEDERVELSSIKCDIDCVQSEWSDWSSCSASCGYGNRLRTRRVEKAAGDGGRECGGDREVDVCFTQPCLYAQYVPGPFSTCQVSNSSTICGPGNRTRQPLCSVNGVVMETTAECEHQRANVTFELSERCDMPCPGECVVSEWTDWNPLQCDTSCPHCQRSRTRSVLRTASDCPTTQELELCDTEGTRHEWEEGEWGACVVVTEGAGAYCGQGTQRRPVECVYSMTREAVHSGLCDGVRPMDERSCTVPCPVDCVVGAFSEWTACPERCETGLEQTRVREEISSSAHGGRACPELTQSRPCPPANCTVYVVERLGESHCDIDLTSDTQCGSAIMSKPLSCRRNTQYVDLSVCREAFNQGLNVIGGDLLNPEPCTVDCPVEPMCTYSEWSPLSECTALCVDYNARFKFRTQALVSSHSGSSDKCKSMQLEVWECDPLEPVPTNSTDVSLLDSCIQFHWNSSVSNDVLEVRCVTRTGQTVSGGCPNVTKPQSCDQPDCPAYSNCDGGRCVCEDQFERVGGLCLPVRGCKDDNHCLYPNRECNTSGECVCKDNFDDTVSVCVCVCVCV